jgi:iron complex outermembrane receptor protein
VRQVLSCNRRRSANIALLLALSLPVQGRALPVAHVNQFSITAQSADESLIEFAKQADLTIIFPFAKVKNRTANALVGTYTVEQGIGILLRDTGLKAEFDDKGALTISQQELPDDDQQGDLFSRLLDFITAQRNEMVTYPEPQEAEFEIITVKGIRASIQRSMDVKRSAFNIVDAIQAEEIGKFPDQNLAESLQRITGVSIDRSEGEGQFVTVRGFGPQFNTVLTNGRRLATDNQGREFSFDTLASELVSGVEVHKTNPASTQSGGIGSTIDIHTARPLDIPGFKVAGSIKALYDTNSEEYSPQSTLLLSHSDERGVWGVLLSLAYQKRNARINEVQTDGWLLNTNIPAEQLHSNATNIFVPRNYDQRVRFDERTRSGGTLVLQYQPSTNLKLTGDYLASDFKVKTDSTSMGHWFTSSNLENVFTDDNGTVVEFEQKIGHATDFHARTFDRPSKLQAIGLNVQWQASNNLQLDFDMSLSQAKLQDTRGAANALSLIGYLNRSHFDHSDSNVLPAISGFEIPDANILDALGQPSGVSDYLDPSNGRAHVMLRRGWNIRDELDQYSMDGIWDGGLEHLSKIKFGLFYTQRSKQNQRWDNEASGLHCTFCGYFDSPDIPDGFQSVFDAGNDFLSAVSGSDNIPKQWLRHDGEQLFEFLQTSSGVSLEASARNNSFVVNENYLASYIQADLNGEWHNMQLSTQVGLRYEDTAVVVSGIEADLIELTILDQTELGQVTATPRPIEVDSHYSNLLPSLNLKLEISNTIVARMAFSRSLTRPTMSQMSPSMVLNTTRQGGDLRASSGNPTLRPFESSNFDVAFEWYFDTSSHVAASYFRKKVDNFIVSTVSELTFDQVRDPSTGDDPNHPDTNDSVATFDLTQPINGETATVDGWELAIQQDFANTGFGLLANMTIVDSNAQLDRNDLTQTFALTGLSDSQNLIAYYQNDPLQLRLAFNHRDGFLQSLVQIQGGEPTFVKGYYQLDFSASYAINDNTSIFFEGINITEQVVYKHGRYDNQLLLVQDTGARYSLGLRGNF